MVARTSVQEHRNEEQINQSASYLCIVAFLCFPLTYEISNAGYIANFEMLPSSVRRNGVELIGTEVTLVGLPSASPIFTKTSYVANTDLDH
jgi:hypothetical protein